MTRPIVTTDGGFLVRINENVDFEVWHLLRGNNDVSHPNFAVVALPLGIQNWLPKVNFVRWATSQRNNDTAGSAPGSRQTPQLLLASDHRTVVLQLSLLLNADSEVEAAGISSDSSILADIEFPGAYGKITETDFVYDGDSILLLFEMAPQASILSLGAARRDDIPNRKFSTGQGHATFTTGKTPGSEPLAVLVRDKHQDLVVVLEYGKVVASFNPGTIDAQGIKWSPNSRPLLLIWDSPAYGSRVKIFDAYGHPFSHLDIGPATSVPAGLDKDFVGLGVCAPNWSKKSGSQSVTILAVGNGSGRILHRVLDTDLLAYTSETVYQQPNSLASTNTEIWQQVAHDSYQRVIGIWDIETSSSKEIQMLATSADGAAIASKAKGSNNVVFIWQAGQPDPTAALVFLKDVRQLLWHPRQSRWLTVITADNLANVYCWQGLGREPTHHGIQRLKDFSSSRWEGTWLASGSVDEPLFMMSSMKLFDVGILSCDEAVGIFTSILTREYMQSKRLSQLAVQQDSSTASIKNGLSYFDSSQVF